MTSGLARALRIWVPVAVALWLAVGIGIARAVPVQPLGVSDVTRAELPVQTLADQTADWMTQVMHRPVERRPIFADPTLASIGAVGGYYQGTGMIALLPAAINELMRVPTAAGGQVMAHELLHDDDDFHCARWAAEGPVDAVSVDLVPAWVQRFLPANMPVMLPQPAYPRYTRMVRVWSMAVSGSRHAQSRAARSARRDLVNLPCLERADALRPFLGFMDRRK